MFSIDQRFLKLKTKRLVRKSDVQRQTTPFDKAKSIGVIFTVEDEQKHGSIDSFVKRLQKEGKSVKVLCYLPKGKENYKFLFDFFVRTDLSFWGKFTSPLIDDFLEEKYDYLFSIDQKINFMVDNIIARSDAKCRIGIFQEQTNEALEMMLKMDSYKDINKVIDQMYHYTIELQKQ